MRLFISIIIVFVQFSIVVAQTQISGKIVDEKGVGLFGVNVSTENLEGSVTDFDGNFTFLVENGSKKLTISSVGYISQIKDVNVKKDEKLVINFTLLEEVIEVEDIIVYGSKRGKLLQEEVQSVEIIKTELLENNNVTDGLDAVQLISGVTVLDGQMSIRGGSGYAYGVGSRVILVVDDIPVLTPERDEINWDFMPTENVSQIELLKGGGSVQYGTSALNGVLNVRSNWAKRKHETEVALYNTFYGQPKVKGANWWRNETHYLNIPHKLGLTFAHRSKLKKNVDISFSGMFHSFQSHLKDEFNERVRFNFNIRHRSEKYSGLSFGLYTMTMYRNDSFFFIWQGNEDKKYLPLATYDKRYNYNMFHPFISYYDQNGNTFKYNGSVYYDLMLHEEIDIKNDNQSFKFYNDFQYQKKFDFGFGFVLGATAENYLAKAPALKKDSVFVDKHDWFKGNKYAAYLLLDYKIKGFTASGGFRYEAFEFLNKFISSKPVFNLGFNYKITKNDYLRLSFAQSFRVPSIAERYVDESLGPVNVYPNPEIRPETGYTSELGYKRMLNNKKWRGFVDVAIYWTEFNDMIEFFFGDFTQPGDEDLKLGFRAENVNRARIFGWEFNIEEKATYGDFEFTSKLGYTYAYGVDLNANSDAKNIGNFLKNAFKGIYITDVQHQQFEVNTTAKHPGNPLYGILKYRFRHTLKLDLNANYKNFGIGTNLSYYSYMDNVDEVFKALIPGIAEDRESNNFTGELVWDVRTNYEIKDVVNFTFIVKNVLNNDYALRPSKQNAPRTFTFQTKFKF